MKSITPLNHWLLRKITGHLVVSEGCILYDIESDQATIQDSLGFVYDVTVKLVARTHDHLDQDGFEAKPSKPLLERLK